MSKVLITGAAGTLGQALIPVIASAGYHLVLVDVQPLESEHESHQIDILDADALGPIMEGVDFVVHAAGLHGIHLSTRSPREFYSINLTGTFNVWEAAVQSGIKGFVFCSSVSVYGESRRPPREDAVVALSENMPLLPSDIYGLTKFLGEEMSRYYVRRYGVAAVALRLGMFTPEPFFRHGIRLLYGGVDPRDAAQAVLKSIQAMEASKIKWEVLNIASEVPFTKEDGPQLRKNPLPVLDKYYKDAVNLLKERGVERLYPIHEFIPISKAGEKLGFRPEYNFSWWLQELEQHPDYRTPKNPPWP